jgi:hypothetical protein
MKLTSNFFHLVYNLIGESLMIIFGYEIDLQLLQVVLQLNWIVEHDDIKVCGFQIDFKKNYLVYKLNWTIFGGPIWIYGYKIDTHLFQWLHNLKNQWM